MDFDGDREYAFSRVRDCFVWHLPSKSILAVSGATERYLALRLTDQNGHELRSVKWEDVAFDPPCIKAFNTPMNSLFTYRRPLRRDWKQGLRGSQFSLDARVPDDNEPYGGNWMRQYWAQIQQALSGVFPSLREAIFDIEEFAQSRVISPDFMISKHFDVEARIGGTVGKVTDEDRIVLSERGRWAKEQLESVIGEGNVEVRG